MRAGIDIGGTKTAFALAPGAGAAPLATRRRPTEASADPRADLRRMAADLRALLDAQGVAVSALEAVGVSAAGPLDPDAGVLIDPPNLPWDRAPVVEVLAAELGCAVFLENDANAAALAEWRHGAGRGCRHMVYLTMSTGVGGGLILDGRLYRGVACSAGEVGHVPVVWEGEHCSCGQRGCLEAYIGGAAWSRHLEKATPDQSLVRQLTPAGEAPRPEQVLEAARRGDAFAHRELVRFNDYLSRGIVQIAFTLAPERIVLGTIVRAAGEELCLQPVRERVRSHLWPVIATPLHILASELGDALADLAGLAVADEGLRRATAG